jgi:hypothetical protein
VNISSDEGFFDFHWRDYTSWNIYF